MNFFKGNQQLAARQKFAHAAIGQGNSLGYKCLFIDSIHIISIICGSAIDFNDCMNIFDVLFLACKNLQMICTIE